MAGQTYSISPRLAPTVYEHLAHHHERARQQGWPDLAPVADIHVIETIIETGFWASLRREEGRSPKISLAFLPPEMAGEPLLFEQRKPLLPSTLARLAPAVERPGIHLGVWREEDDLVIWGATRTLPTICFVLEVIEPGVLVIKYSRDQVYGKFGNIAVLRGDQVDVVHEEEATHPDCPALLSSLLGIDSPISWLDSTNVLVQLAISMRAHGRGGAVLVVPAGTLAWEQSIVLPIPYRVEPPFTKLTHLVWGNPEANAEESWKHAVLRAVEGIAGLTAVDGATVMSEQYEVLAFGAKIKRAEGETSIKQVVVSEPVVGNTIAIVSPGQIGGTRHFSAAQFVHDQRDAVALVASQDGRFTIFTWSDEYQLVRAHRVDTLLI